MLRNKGRSKPTLGIECERQSIFAPASQKRAVASDLNPKTTDHHRFILTFLRRVHRSLFSATAK
jgi:hypothetical protein